MNPEEMKERLEKAIEKPLSRVQSYEDLFIIPKYKESYESGYRDIAIYGARFSKEKGEYKYEYLFTSDNLITEFRGSFFNKIKDFQIHIDMPYLENIIHLWLSRGLYFRVYNLTIDIKRSKE